MEVMEKRMSEVFAGHRKAMEQAKVSTSELTPEDAQMLQLAVLHTQKSHDARGPA